MAEATQLSPDPRDISPVQVAVCLSARVNGCAGGVGWQVTGQPWLGAEVWLSLFLSDSLSPLKQTHPEGWTGVSFRSKGARGHSTGSRQSESARRQEQKQGPSGRKQVLEMYFLWWPGLGALLDY